MEPDHAASAPSEPGTDASVQNGSIAKVLAHAFAARLKVFLILIVLILFVGPLAGKMIYESKNKSAVQRLCENISTNSTKAEMKTAAELIQANFKEYRLKTEVWSFIYFGCLFGSAVCSVLAGLILKFEKLPPKGPELKRDLAAVFAALAALLVTLSTAGDFNRKWQANRVAATATENLAYELPKAPAETSKIYERLQAINTARNEGILGASLQATNAPSK